MAGASKKRAQRERQDRRDGDPSSSSSDATSKSHEVGFPARSQTVAAPNLDGNRDPEELGYGKPVPSSFNNNRLDLDTNGWAIAHDSLAVLIGMAPGMSSASIGAEADSAGTYAATFNKRLDEFLTEFQLSDATLRFDAPKRPADGTLGQSVKVGLNTFDVVSFPGNTNNTIYQHDVLVGNGDQKRAVIKKVFRTDEVQAVVGRGCLFDGNRLAWSLNKIEKEVHINVDLDQVEIRNAQKEDRPPRVSKKVLEGKIDPNDRKRSNKFVVHVRTTKIVKFDTLMAYLNGKGIVEFSKDMLDSINFLDHCLREKPSQTMTAIKRSFFKRPERCVELKGHLEAWKGVFATLRAVRRLDGPGLSVNVDVSNGVFWKPLNLRDVAWNLCGYHDYVPFAQDFQRFMKLNSGQSLDPRDTGTYWSKCDMYGRLKRLRKVEVYVRKRGKHPIEVMMINNFPGLDCDSYRIELKDSDGGNSKYTSIYKYFQDKYKIAVPNRMLPVVEMTKKGTVLPMDFCQVKDCQRYPFKLDEKETSSLMKFAVQPPKQRWESIEEGIKHLNWQNDNYLRNYGFAIAKERTVVQARVLPAPDIHFGRTKDTLPGKVVGCGRWRIDGKHFVSSPSFKLDSWGFFTITGRTGASVPAVQQFAKKLMEVWGKHGYTNMVPPMVAEFPMSGDFGSAVVKCWNACGSKFNIVPKLLIFVMPNRDAQIYYRLKKSMDCRFGVASQCMQAAHLVRGQEQYISNVLLKINAKLGGINTQAVLPKGVLQGTKLRLLSSDARPMIIGADVSHGAPNTAIPSIAALTMSKNLACTQYLAVTDTNGFRFEIIQDRVLIRLRDQIFAWTTNNGGRLPTHILYLRDGVSDQQYVHVISSEVKAIKEMIRGMIPENFDRKKIPKFIVMVASKRHHVRFFPEGNTGDKTGNPLPGTIVEQGVTHPFQHDWYLCAHQAIKGTARPVHYHVLMNEDDEMTVNELQQYVYMHSYQYCRSTTPVSLHPAIYYAHLAGLRCKAHENKGSEQIGTTLDLWNQEIANRQLKDQKNKEAFALGKPAPYPNEDLRISKEAIHAADIPGIPKNFDPDHPTAHLAPEERGRQHLLPLFDQNHPKYPQSMYFA